ncbi:MAB_1171c family putative transporter [Kitasatospora sp. NPDC048296]|uniref:MAB_1171c family putative transporter n=1 Tax=Kitasatospora sp. NPDC048296 TaxID=3364048 RepID=UPI0037168B54
MLAELKCYGAWLQNASVAALWFTVLLRAPSAVRSRWQRNLWLAIATAAAAMTLNLPPVLNFLHQLTGSTEPADVSRNLIGVISAAAVLDFVTFTTGYPRLRVQLHGTTVLVVIVLLGLDATAPTHTGHTIPPMGGPFPSTAYWLLLISVQLAANVACVVVCWRYGQRSDNRPLRICLQLFSGGTACAGLFWLGYLVYLPTRAAWIVAPLPLLMGLHGVLRSAALATPAFLGLRRKARDVANVWQLWPLWRVLIAAVPHVALSDPRARIREVVRPRGSWKLLAYRKVIEIRDAILVLSGGTPPELLQAAEEHVASTGAPPSQVDAAVMACVLRVSRPGQLGAWVGNEQLAGWV